MLLFLVNELTVNTKSNTDTFLLLSLGLSSFGGAHGRFIYGIGLFDILLIILFVRTFFLREDSLLIFNKDVFSMLIIYVLVILYGLYRTISEVNSTGYQFIIMELRFFIYYPVFFYITLKHSFNISFFQKIFPYISLCYIVMWTFCLYPGSEIHNFLYDINNMQLIGDKFRIFGPNVLIFVPLMLTLINCSKIRSLDVIIYCVLILIIFIKSGGRTYFIYYLIPIFYLLYQRRKQKKIVLISLLSLFCIYYFLTNYTDEFFLLRLSNVINVTSDSSFMYRVHNMLEMYEQLNTTNILFGNGIGSSYIVYLAGWRVSFFLDNTFATLIYKIGVIGLIIFMLPFLRARKIIPKSLYLCLISGLILIGSTSYHLITNPVFSYGFFLVFFLYKRQFLIGSHSKS
ncbi:hypothetical protein DBB_48830 [Desulfoluna spongiiphila]|nr:hypothetical protein DBB_48830 [Desulfoluna spongiiphila]